MTGTMDLDHFAALLADRLSAIVPAGFCVTAGGGMLWYSEQGESPVGPEEYRFGSGTYIREFFNAYGESDRERVVGAAVRALDELQDYISESTHDPWPGATRQPSPHGRISGSSLHLWYEDQGNVLLYCDPIQLTDVGFQG